MDPMTSSPPADRPPHPPARPQNDPVPAGQDSSGPISSGPAAPGAAAVVAPGPAHPGTDGPGISDASGGRLGAEGLRPVSPRLVPARYLATIPGYVIGVLLAAGAVVAAVLTGWWWLGLLALIPLVVVAQSLLLTPRRVRAIGYRDAEEDLTIALGIMFRSVHTIPFGRVQSVKIDEGPVDRRYGLAKLTISTAHDGAGVTLPGLPKDEAERLRALLTARGVELMAAL
jgi:membrane protein YdbS with pleckstrin-like domain